MKYRRVVALGRHLTVYFDITQLAHAQRKAMISDGTAEDFHSRVVYINTFKVREEVQIEVAILCLIK